MSMPMHGYPSLKAIVPPMVPWRGYWRAVLNLLFAGLSVLSGTWIVHQSEYFVEFGQRFGGVMAANPHAYMGPVGGVLLAAFLCGLTSLVLVLQVATHHRWHIMRRLPTRLARQVALPVRLPAKGIVGCTAAALFLCQTSAYLIQENVESLAITGQLPGVTVLLAPQHATVLPLHVLMSICLAILLWTASAFLRRSRRLVHLARVFAAFVARAAGHAPRLEPHRRDTPNLRLSDGSCSLRSPPLGA